MKKPKKKTEQDRPNNPRPNWRPRVDAGASGRPEPGRARRAPRLAGVLLGQRAHVLRQAVERVDPLGRNRGTICRPGPADCGSRR